MTRSGRAPGAGGRRRAAGVRIAVLAALLPALGAPAASADWYRGAGIALMECGGCHEVRRESGIGGTGAGPPLPVLARDCRWGAGSLARYLSTSHALLMGHALEDRNREDVVAYLRSLRLIEALGKPEIGAALAAREDLPGECR